MAFSMTRAKILAIIKKGEPISITSLSKQINLSRGTTIYRYLEELEQRGLIKRYKELKKRGQPTMLITTEKAKPLSLKFLEKLESPY